MKFVLALLLIFSVIVDFSSMSSESEISVSSCDTTTVCSDVDLHSDKAQDEHDDEHCHCHAGHIHIGIVNSSIVNTHPPHLSSNKEFSKYNLNKAIQFHSEINRPPIA